MKRAQKQMQCHNSGYKNTSQNDTSYDDISYNYTRYTCYNKTST